MTFSRIFKKLHRAFDFCPLGKEESFRVRFFETMNEVPASFQDMLDAQNNLFIRPAYLKVVEDSKPVDMRFAYACVEKKSRPCAFFYFQLHRFRLDQADRFLNPDCYGKALADLNKASRNRLFRSFFSKPMHIMFCGNVFLSGEHGIYIHPSVNYADLADALPVLMDEVIDQAKEQVKIAGVVVKDFYDEKTGTIPVLEKEGYMKFYFEPNMIMDVRQEWNSFDDYIQDLSSKYRVRAKNVLKKAGAVVVKEFSEKDIKANADVLVALHRNVHQKSAVHFSETGIAYFAGLKNKLKNNFLFKGFYLDGNLVAFSSAIYENDWMEAHLIGLDYDFNKSHALYPFLLYDYIEEAISRRIKTICFGRTASEIKSTVGARAYPMFCYIGLQGPLSMKLVTPFIDLSKKEDDFVVRDPFKVTAGNLAMEERD